MLPLCKRIASLQRLEQLGRICAPVSPVPNPLRMEAVLGGKNGDGSDTFEILSRLGQTTLKMLFALVYYAEKPYDDAHRLEQHVEVALNSDRLAVLAQKSGFIAEVIDSLDWLPRLSGVEKEDAEGLLTALVGAYVSEKGGDFYSVVKLWHWLAETDELSTCF